LKPGMLRQRGTKAHRLAFVTNFCPHYRVKTYEALARDLGVEFFFFSAGDDWYWLQEHGTRVGRFRFRNLPGFRMAGARVTPTLPLVLWRGRYDAYIKCINGRFALPMTYLAARLARRPFILWTGLWTRLETPIHRLLFPITRYIYRHADAVVVYGEHVKRYLESEGVQSDRVFVAPHAVDNAAYNQQVSAEETVALRRQFEIDAAAKVILYVGRLEEGKGLPFLLEAFATLRRTDAVLLLVGAGSERSRLEQMAHALEISDRVRFAGYVPPTETVAYYALAYVYVLPSVATPVFKEPWGLVVNEAFNQGVPVIATDSVGAAAGGLLRDGINGCVVRERDARALTAALRNLLDDPALRDTMAQNARSTIARWDNDGMVLGFRRAIERVLNVVTEQGP
jgi:glycosyltransferase involved in cell wall biosynthesis